MLCSAGNLSRLWAKSSLALLFAALFALGLAGRGAAHEVRPAVGDVTVGADTVRLDLRVTLEAMVAGIDLNGLDDTNNSPLSGYYDQLRAQSPEMLEAALQKAWPRIASGIVIEVGGQKLLPQLDSVRIPEVGDTALPRDSTLIVTAALPKGDAAVVAGWIAAYGPLVLRQVGEGDELYTGYLTNGALSDPLPRQGVAKLSGLTEFGRYIALGFYHIVPKGLDHILFVLGLFFFSLHVRPLLMQVTAFTLAHTVTLALATLKIVSVPPQIVEPLIAASIVYVALEDAWGVKMSVRRTAVVFGFGLLHGLGFASVLGEIGLNPARLISGLIGFNIGVELGQLAIISVAFLMVGVWFGNKPWYRTRISIPASLVIAAVGAYWFAERTFL